MPDWQTIATLICLAVAGIFLARRTVQFLHGGQKSGCGSCAAQGDGSTKRPLVPLDLPDQRR